MQDGRPQDTSKDARRNDKRACEYVLEQHAQCSPIRTGALLMTLHAGRGHRMVTSHLTQRLTIDVGKALVVAIIY